MNLRDRVLGEVEKNSFIALSDKGGHRGNALKTVSPPGGGSEEFYSHGSKRRPRSARGHSFGGEVSGSRHHQPSGSKRSGVYMLVGSIQFTSPPGRDFSICKTAQRYCYVYPLRENQDPAPRLHYCFLTALPLSLHPLPSLISNCLNLLFGTQGGSRRLNEAYILILQ